MTGLHEYESFLDTQDKLVFLDGNDIVFKLGQIKTINTNRLNSEAEILNKVEDIIFYLLEINNIHHNYLTKRILRLIKQATGIDFDFESLALRLYIDAFGWQFVEYENKILSFVPEDRRPAFSVSIIEGYNQIQVKKPLWGYPDYFLTATVNSLAVKKLSSCILLLLPNNTIWQHNYINPVKLSEAHQSKNISLIFEGQDSEQELVKISKLCQVSNTPCTIT